MKFQINMIPTETVWCIYYLPHIAIHSLDNVITLLSNAETTIWVILVWNVFRWSGTLNWNTLRFVDSSPLCQTCLQFGINRISKQFVFTCSGDNKFSRKRKWFVRSELWWAFKNRKYITLLFGVEAFTNNVGSRYGLFKAAHMKFRKVPYCNLFQFWNCECTFLGLRVKEVKMKIQNYFSILIYLPATLIHFSDLPINLCIPS